MNPKILYSLSITISIIFLSLTGCSKEWPDNPPDVSRPEIVNTVPPSGSFLAKTDSPVQVSFSENMELSSLNANTIVTNTEGDTVEGTWSQSGSLYTFTPENNLQELNAYNVTLKGAFTEDGIWKNPGVRDKNGNSLYNDFVFNFATASSVQNTTLYFGRGPDWEYDQSGQQKGIGYVELSDDGADGEITVKTVGDFAPGNLNLFFNPSHDKIYVADYSGNQVHILNTSTNQFESDVDAPIAPTFIAFVPNGQEFWVIGKDSAKILIVNAASNEITGEMDFEGEELNSMAINNAGTKGYITTGSSNSGSVIIIDIAARSVITTLADVILNGLDYAFANDIWVSSDDSKVFFFNNYASPQIRIITSASNTIDNDITLPAGGSDDEWITFKSGDLLYAMARWGSGGFKIDMNDNSVKAQHSLDEAGCYLGAFIDPSNDVVFAVGNPTWDSPSNGIFSIFRSSDMKKILTLKTVNEDGVDLPWRYMLAK